MALLIDATVMADNGMSLSQSLSANSIAFESDVTLEIVLSWPGSQHRYVFDRPLKPELTGLKVGRYSTTVGSQETDTGEVTTKRFVFQLVPLSAGRATIAPMTISYVIWPDSISGELVTEPAELLVASPIPVAQGKDGLPGWLKALIVLAVIGLAGGVWQAVRRKRLAAEPVRIPREEFLLGLTNLKGEAGSDLKKFQTGLYPLLLTYLNEEFGISVEGQSVDNIIASLEATSLSESKAARLAEWLKRAEREKYAPVDAGPGETVRLANAIHQFVEQM